MVRDRGLCLFCFITFIIKMDCCVFKIVFKDEFFRSLNLGFICSVMLGLGAELICIPALAVEIVIKRIHLDLIWVNSRKILGGIYLIK